MSASCGFWPTSRGSLLAAIVDLDGLLIAIELLPDDDEERSAWISRAQYLYGPFLELVLSESLVRHDGFGRTALVLGHRVWVAPSELVHALARAAWYRPAPRQLATMLARWPRIARIRPALRCLPADPGPRQLQLFA